MESIIEVRLIAPQLLLRDLPLRERHILHLIRIRLPIFQITFNSLLMPRPAEQTDRATTDKEDHYSRSRVQIAQIVHIHKTFTTGNIDAIVDTFADHPAIVVLWVEG